MNNEKHEIYCNCNLTNLLIKAGFDWQDYFVAHNIIEHFHWEIPLHIAQKWLREVKGIHICVQPVNSEVNKETHKCDIEYLVMIFVNNNSIGGVDFVEMTEPFKTHEEAQEAGIKKCLTLILEENENR